jgi:hypothetical protein
MEVRRKSVGLNTRFLLACSLLPVLLVAPGTGMTSARAANAAGPIVPARLVFYRGLDCFKAGKHGKPATGFGPLTDYVNAVIIYKTWNGFHRVTFRFYTPDGKLNKKYTDAFRGHGPTRDCAWIGIAGHPRSKKLGRWTVRVSIDGRPRLVGHFQLHR